eukprot:SAG11_NODE_12671_length_691_cov_1.268581_1_plen_51_part_00
MYSWFFGLNSIQQTVSFAAVNDATEPTMKLVSGVASVLDELPHNQGSDTH